MPSIFRRLKTLWELSSLDVSKNQEKGSIFIDYKPEKPKMAQIIRMKNPVKDILKEE